MTGDGARPMTGDGARGPITITLPYGAVMATGGASRVAGMCGLAWLGEPLLWLAVAEALWILVRNSARQRNRWHAWLDSLWHRSGCPSALTGMSTVPLGLAVVSSGLATQGGVPRAILSPMLLVAAWLTTVVFGARFMGSVASHGRSARVDGGWFLPPAALLSAGIATAAYASHTGAAEHDALAWLTLAAASIGATGYWATCLVAMTDVLARGASDRPMVLWWIAAGCGGLAAASLAAAASARRGAWPLALSDDLHVLATATWVLASVLAVGVIGRSTWWLVGTRPRSTAAPWPPTFSSAVFALGSLAVGTFLHAPAILAVADAAAGATIALWVVTASLHVAGAWSR